MPTSTAPPGTRLFFSYGHDENTELVHRLKADLQARGFSVWIDASEIKAGDDWRRSITDGLVGTHGVLAFLSRHSMRDPGVCRDELHIALGVRNLHVSSILLEAESDVSPPPVIAQQQWLDLSAWRSVYRRGGPEWEAWYSRAVDSVVAMIAASDPGKLVGEITELRRRLRPATHAGRDAEIAQGKVLRRPWLSERVDLWRRDTDERAPKILMIFGGPGTGKSTFAATTLYESCFAISGVFCEYNSREFSDGGALARQLAFNLATKLPDYRRLLLGTIENYRTVDQFDSHDQLNLLVTSPLGSCIDGGREQFVIVVDALDEAIEKSRFAETLMREVPRWPRWLKLLVTARPQPRLRSLFDTAAIVDLDAEHERQQDDIRHFVAERLRMTSGGIAAQRLGDQICDAADHSFAYAKAVLSSDLETLQEHGLQLPKGIGAQYRTMLDRALAHDGIDWDTVRRLLEMLIVDGDLDTATLANVVGHDRRRIRDLIYALDGVIREQSADGPRPRTVSLFHASLATWLADEDRSGDYFADPALGAANLAMHARVLVTGQKGLITVDDSTTWRLRHAQERLASYHSAADAWGEYASFLTEPDTPLNPYWAEFDSLPNRYITTATLARLRTITQQPWQQIEARQFEGVIGLMASAFGVFAQWTPTSTTQLLLGEALESRSCSVFLRSPASDDSMRPWDKLALAGSVMTATATHRDHGLPVSSGAANEAQWIALSSCYMGGSPKLSDFDLSSIQMRQHLRGGFCELTDRDLPSDVAPATFDALRRAFNTGCLADGMTQRSSLSSYYDTTMNAVQAGVAHGANLADARRQALGVMSTEVSGVHKIGIASLRDADSIFSSVANELSQRSRWHPQPPIFHHGLGAHQDYSEVYVFPCCGKYVVVGDEAPHQRREDGCCPAPTEQELEPQ